MIKLTQCSIDSTVNEIFGFTVITQKFTNYSSYPIEVQVALPLCPEAILHKFVIKTNGEEICSKVMPTDVANQKYFESMVNNDIGIKGNYTKNNYFEISIGQVPPNREIELMTHIVQLVELSEDAYSFTISPEVMPYAKPVSFDPPYQECVYNPMGNYKVTEVNREAHCGFNPNAKYTFQKPIVPYDKDLFYEAFDMRVNIMLSLANGALTSLTSSTNVIHPNYLENSKKASIALMIQGKKPVEILFKTSMSHAVQLFEEYDAEKEIYAYTLHYHYSKAIGNANEFSIQAPSQFYFILDQSNSMKGDRIKMAKEAMLLFIQSLPLKSTLGLIGFGSNFNEYSKGMSEYNQKTTDALISKIRHLDANMSGTKLFEPLRYSFERFNYSNGLCKHIFIVTDGIVFNPESCYNLASINQNHFRIHSIGIGDAVDASFLKKISRYGNGATVHVKDVATLSRDIIQTLQKAIKPYLNIDISIDCIKIIEYPPSNSKRVLFDQEFFNYSFITKTKLSNQTEVNVNVYDPITNSSYSNKQAILPIVKLADGNVLNKAIVGTLLKQSQQIDPITKGNLSVEFQVLSDVTSLFGEVKRKDKEGLPVNMLILNRYEPVMYQNVYMSRPYSSCSSLNCSNRQSKISSLSRECVPSNVMMKKKHLSQMTQFYQAQTLVLSSKPAHKPQKALQVSSYSSTEMKPKTKAKETTSTLCSEYDAIVQSQNMFEGYWAETPHTSKLKTKFKKQYEIITALIKDKLNLTSKDIVSRIVYTYLVIHFLYEKHKDRLAELALIINKGKAYLITNGLPEENLPLLN